MPRISIIYLGLPQAGVDGTCELALDPSGRAPGSPRCRSGQLNPVRRLAAGRAERGQNISERQALTHSWRRAME